MPDQERLASRCDWQTLLLSEHPSLKVFNGTLFMYSLCLAIAYSLPAVSYQGRVASSIYDLESATGIKLLSKVVDLRDKLGNFGSQYAANKKTLVQAINSSNANQQEKAIIVAMAMQETNEMKGSQHDTGKYGDGENFGMFNMNRQLLTILDPSISESDIQRLNEDSSWAIYRNVPLLLAGLRKNDKTRNIQWEPINSLLNFNRGGWDGFCSTGQMNGPWNTIGYRERIAAMAFMILNDNSLLYGDVRINSDLYHQ